MINTMRVIAGGLKPIRYLTFLQIVHAILTGLPTIMMFFVIKELIKPLEPPNTDKLIAYCLIIALIMIVNVLLARRLYLRNFIESYSITTNARLRLADHLRLLSLGFFKRRDPGDISALMLQDMAKVEQIFSHFFTEAVASAVLPLMLGLGLLTEDPRLVGVMVGSLALAVPALIFGQKAVGRLGARQLETRNRASSGILEYVQGINTLKAFSMTGPAFARLNQTLKKLTKDSFSLEAGTALPISAFGLILDLGLVATLAMAAYFLFTGKIALVGFVLFAAVGVKFFEPLLNFAVFFTEMRYMGLAAQRISKVFAEKP
ncbi:MAG: ABC transporter ATP-binding protein/permease, partial [Deltaproteobacteria bacterium]|nr:ABC transporter ATP-binding protein/permease [Deltaproteobacteria bacterium]